MQTLASSQNQDMKELFEKFKSLNILVIGDIMIDKYVWGKVDRISPEAPVPIVRVHKHENRLGGAANVALNVQSLGANPIICAIVGEDHEGQELKSLMEEHGLNSFGILALANRLTTVKTRVIAHNQQIVRIDSESEQLIDPDQTRDILEKIKEIINSKAIDAIIFEDYDKGLLHKDLIENVVELANQKGILTVVDPKKNNFPHYKNVSLYKPNLKELAEGLNISIDPQQLAEVEVAVARLAEEQQLNAVLLTLSEHGAYILCPDGKKLIPAHVRDIADVSGAGDTVIATATLCLAAGMSFFKTAELANLAGGLVCEHAGVVPIGKEELLREAEKLI